MKRIALGLLALAACADLDPATITTCVTSDDCLDGRVCVAGTCLAEAPARDGGEIARDGGVRDAGSAPPRDAGPSRDGGPIDAGPNQAPSITMTNLVVDGIEARLTVDFTDPDPGAGVMSVRVDWGDGTTVRSYAVAPASTSSTVVYEYDAADSYVVQITVSDGIAQSAEETEIAVIAFPRTGLVSEYELDGENYMDSSGRGNHATGQTLCVVPIPDRTGFASRAIELNGPMSGGDGCGLDDTGRFTFTDPGVNTAFTISTWLDPESNGGDYVVAAQIGTSSFDFMWARLVTGRDPFLRTTDRISFIVPDIRGRDGVSILEIGTNQTPDEGWYNVTVTVEPSGGGSLGILYIDGVERDRMVSATPVSNPAANDLWIVGNADDDQQGNRYYRGFIDDVRFYDRALSPNEVLALVRLE